MGLYSHCTKYWFELWAVVLSPNILKYLDWLVLKLFDSWGNLQSQAIMEIKNWSSQDPIGISGDIHIIQACFPRNLIEFPKLISKKKQTNQQSTSRMWVRKYILPNCCPISTTSHQHDQWWEWRELQFNNSLRDTHYPLLLKSLTVECNPFISFRLGLIFN